MSNVLFTPDKKNKNIHGPSGFSENEFTGFDGKVFHLSTDFKNEQGKRFEKKDFAKLIENLGGECKGVVDPRNLNRAVTDYLVIGGLKPKITNNQINTEKANMDPNKKTIPIMDQVKCEELIEMYQKVYKP